MPGYILLSGIKVGLSGMNKGYAGYILALLVYAGVPG
jgi:hypothetical protein